MKEICPFHSDSRPSAEVYPSGRRFCFVCWRGYVPDGVVVQPGKKEPPEDLVASLATIRSLPIKQIRGLPFRANDRGYFLEWPSGTYYKLRTYKGEPRYLCPKGHRQPLLVLGAGLEGLMVVEGEINAMSIALVLEPLGWTVVSPGSAGGFKEKAEEIRQLSSAYPKLCLWADFDAPGVRALWEMGRVWGERPYNYLLPDKDANDILVQEGLTGLTSRLRLLINEG